LRKSTRSLFARLLVNVAVSALTFLAAVTLVQPAAQWALHLSVNRPFGLVPLLNAPAWLELVVSFLLMDLAFYYWHLANHRAPFLWRFHNVHHTDPDLDVSTAFRFHFGEIVLSSAFTVLQICLIGISPWAYAVYQLAFQSEVLFHHSNLRLPIRFERLLNKVLVTPRMHGIHHSQVHRENNSNFGTVFPWWDRLHHTLGLNVPQSEIVIGIPGYSLPEDNTVPKTLLMPFRKQRDYWRTRDGKVVERGTTPADLNPGRLAE
jgi:sterol desaturase/sphingolipid hydroxylase (fatty acid hydroxylase superfamily)